MGQVLAYTRRPGPPAAVAPPATAAERWPQLPRLWDAARQLDEAANALPGPTVDCIVCRRGLVPGLSTCVHCDCDNCTEAWNSGAGRDQDGAR